MIHQLYFFAQDDSGHWYMIPAHLRALWDQANALQGNGEAYEVAMEMFDAFALDGGIHHIEFYLPENNKQ